MQSSNNILPSSLQSSLHQLMERVKGIQVILLSTSEGVPLGRVLDEDDDEYMEQDVLSSLESTWAPPSKLYSLLQQGKVQSVTASYNHSTLVHLYQTPVVVTMVVKPNSNLGAIRSTAIPLLKELLAPLCETLLSSLQPPGEEVLGASGYYQ